MILHLSVLRHVPEIPEQMPWIYMCMLREVTADIVGFYLISKQWQNRFAQKENTTGNQRRHDSLYNIFFQCRYFGD